MAEDHEHSRYIYNSYYYDGHRVDPSDLDLAAYIDDRIANAGGGNSYFMTQCFASAALSSSSNTRYAGFGFATAATTFGTTESQRQTIIPVTGTISAFYVRASNNILNGSNITFKLRINGADVGDPITFALGDDSITTNMVVLEVPVAAGDLLAISAFNETTNIVSLYSVAIKIT